MQEATLRGLRMILMSRMMMSNTGEVSENRFLGAQKRRKKAPKMLK